MGLTTWELVLGPRSFSITSTTISTPNSFQPSRSVSPFGNYPKISSDEISKAETAMLAYLRTYVGKIHRQFYRRGVLENAVGLAYSIANAVTLQTLTYPFHLLRSQRLLQPTTSSNIATQFHQLLQLDRPFLGYASSWVVHGVSILSNKIVTTFFSTFLSLPTTLLETITKPISNYIISPFYHAMFLQIFFNTGQTFPALVASAYSRPDRVSFGLAFITYFSLFNIAESIISVMIKGALLIPALMKEERNISTREEQQQQQQRQLQRQYNARLCQEPATINTNQTRSGRVQSSHEYATVQAVRSRRQSNVYPLSVSMRRNSSGSSANRTGTSKPYKFKAQLRNSENNRLKSSILRTYWRPMTIQFVSVFFAKILLYPLQTRLIAKYVLNSSHSGIENLNVSNAMGLFWMEGVVSFVVLEAFWLGASVVSGACGWLARWRS